jgi:Putative DNA-binding domain
MQQAPIPSCAVLAEAATVLDEFSRSLLDPARDVPDVVRGKATKRFAVYRNNVTLGLVRAMEANFPAVRQLLGQKYFAGLVQEFVQAHPPVHPLMFLYGEAFADYLARQDDLSNFPYLADVARLEHVWRSSYHAEDAMTLTPVAFTAFSEEEFLDLRFVAHPAFAIVYSKFALHAIFTASRAGEGPDAIDPRMPEHVLVTRPRFDVLTRVVTRDLADFLLMLVGGATLGEAAETGLASCPAFDLPASIQVMLEAGVFQSIKF